MRTATVALLVGIIGVAAATAPTYFRERTCSIPDFMSSEDDGEFTGPALFQKAFWGVKH